VNFGRNDTANMQVGGGLAWMFPVTQRNQGQVAVAEAANTRATDLRENTQRVLAHHARATYEQLDTLRATLTALDATGIPAQQRLVDATTGSYRAGKLEFVRVLQARRDMLATLGRRLDLVSQAWRRYAEMTALVGEIP
jgi:cobalt-zinc-cadmium efflux system outer membrane protein